MGTFTHRIIVTNPDTRSSLTVDALVDTGATFTMVPGSQLEALGLRPTRTVRVTLADGRLQELPMGRAAITVGDRSEISPCLFGPEGSPALLGAVTLEVLLLAVDPARKTLAPMDAYLV